MDLFERLADDERPQRAAFRFVLALILMRKRLLRFAGRKAGGEGGKEWWLMRPKGVGADQPPRTSPVWSHQSVKCSRVAAQFGFQPQESMTTTPPPLPSRYPPTARAVAARNSPY